MPDRAPTPLEEAVRNHLVAFDAWRKNQSMNLETELWDEMNRTRDVLREMVK